MTPPRRPLRPRPSPLGVSIDTRHLSPEEALFLAETLNALAVAVWDAFGDDTVRPDWDTPWPMCQSCPAISTRSNR